MAPKVSEKRDKKRQKNVLSGRTCVHGPMEDHTRVTFKKHHHIAYIYLHNTQTPNEAVCIEYPKLVKVQKNSLFPLC